MTQSLRCRVGSQAPAPKLHAGEVVKTRVPRPDQRLVVVRSQNRSTTNAGRSTTLAFDRLNLSEGIKSRKVRKEKRCKIHKNLDKTNDLVHEK